MSDAFDDRQRGLDEESLRRKKDNEAIDKLREQMRISAEAKAAATASMSCPRCDGQLNETRFEEVQIDVCEKCGGVWLDSGELEQLTTKEKGGWFNRFWFAEG